MKCHVFVWDFHCASVSYNNFYQFDEDFREAVCPKLIKYVGIDAMNDLQLVSTDEFDPQSKAEFMVAIPVEHYNDSDFDEIEEAVGRAADEYLGGWSFGQDKDQEF